MLTCFLPKPRDQINEKLLRARARLAFKCDAGFYIFNDFMCVNNYRDVQVGSLLLV